MTNTERLQNQYGKREKPSGRAWTILALACILLCGNYYCYDIPAALSRSLQEYFAFGDTKWNYTLNLLYSVYSIPNLILPVMSGLLIDKLSPSRTIIIFSVVVLAGQIAFTIATHYKSITMMLIARALFGVGGEALEVAQAVIVSTWFPNNAGLALGLTLTAARISSAANDNISPSVFAYAKSPDAPNLLGVLVATCSVIAAIIIAYMTSLQVLRQTSACTDVERQPLIGEPHCDDIPSIGESSSIDTDNTSTTQFWSNKIHPAFWPLCAACIFCYATVNPYMHILQGYLETKYYPGNPIFAARVRSIPDLMSAVGSPLVGFLLDRYGFRSLSLPFSSMIILAVHLIVMNSKQASPIPVMMLLGVAYSIFAAALWPCVPALVDRQFRATAYGVLTIAMNIALTVTPIFVGVLMDHGGYWLMEVGFIAGSIAAAVAGSTVFLLDYKNGKRLLRPAVHDE